MLLLINEMQSIRKVRSRKMNDFGDETSTILNVKEVTNLDQEMETQTVRIQSILKDLRNKSVIGFSILALLTKKIHFLQKTLTEDHFRKVKDLSEVDYYGDITHLVIELDKEGKSSKDEYSWMDEESYCNRPHKKYPELSSILTILNEYPEVIHEAEIIIEEYGNFLPACYTYLESLPYLCKRIIDKISMTSSEINQKNMMIAQSTKVCVHLREKIIEIKKKAKDVKIEFHNEMRKRDIRLATFRQHNQTEKKKDQFKLAFDSTVKMSACNMVIASKEHETKIIELTKDHKEEENSFNNTLQYHLSNEKSSRLRRLKRENQLMSWIHKYDFEMSVRNGELDVIEKRRDGFLESKKNIKERLAEIEVKHDIMMFERNREYEEEMEKKCNALKMDHSIRVLQRMVLMMKHRLRIKASKKSKSKKKKTRVEVEVAVEA